MRKGGKKLRRSGAKIMASLIALLGSLSYVMIFAVINGSLGFISAIGVTVCGAVGIAKAIAEATGGIVAVSYELIIGLAVGFGLIRGVLHALEQYTNHYIAFKILAVIRDKVFGALRILCPAKLETKQKGNIIAMLTADIETLEVFYAHTISPICIAIIVSVMVLLFVGFISSWYLALVALVGHLVIGIVVPLISSAKLKEGGVQYRKEFAGANAYFLDSIKGIKDIVLHGAEEVREQEVNRRSDELLKETNVIKRGSTITSATVELIISLLIVVAVATGILLVKSDVLNISNMIIGVVAVFSSFGPVIAIAALPSNLTQTFASGDRVLNLLAEKPVVEEITSGQDMDFNEVVLKELSFAYEGEDEVLHDVNFHVSLGEMVGLVGASGCGKSTILKLLLRFWGKSSGEILYDGVDVDKINTSSLLDNVTMVSQNAYLFDDTIEENLKIAKPDATHEEIEEACLKASVHDFIMSLPKGYATEVGTLGDNLSAGEKQRIGLARAFLSGRKLILLDEPTSNVDSMNEGMILRSLAEHKEGKAIVLISHRESTVAITDRVYRVEKGIVREA